MNFEFNENLIEKVKCREEIWNPKAKGHKNFQLVRRLWEEVASELDSDVETCRTRWKTIRDRYNKERKKKPTGAGASSSVKWPLMEQMEFRLPCMSAFYRPIYHGRITISNFHGFSLLDLTGMTDQIDRVMLILELLLALVVAVYFLWKWKVSYWQRRGVPCLNAKFPFGSIADIILMRKTIGEVYDEIYYNLNGAPFGGIYRFWWPALFVRDPEMVKAVFVKEFTSFHDNDYYVDPKVDTILGLNPFNSKGDRWKHARGIVTPSLTILKVKGMIPGIKTVCKQMTDHLATQNDVFLEAYDLMGKYTTDVVGCSAYGIDSNSFEDPNSTLRQMSSKMFDGSLKGNIALLCALYAPTLGGILKFKILTEEVNQYFIGIVREAVKLRKKNNVDRGDFLQSLINTNNEAEAKGEPPVYSEEEMAAHSMTFFLDGYETAALLLGFIMYELSLNPVPQDKLREEILKNGKDLSAFDFEKIHELPYLEMVVMETLRKHPSGTSFSRLCTQEILLKSQDGSEVLVEKGTPVILPMYSLHNDPEYFPDPDKFDPERFTEDNRATRPQFSFFPFGGGPRSCPGNKFAMTMVKLAVISVILLFKVEPKEIPQGKLELEPLNQFFHSAKNGLWVKFNPADIN